MYTQKSSKVRVKKDTIGDCGLKALYEVYNTMTTEQFRSYCIDVIERSTGKRNTKDKFIREIDSSQYKDLMVKKVTNYLLAGQGLGV